LPLKAAAKKTRLAIHAELSEKVRLGQKVEIGGCIGKNGLLSR
jgi:hypothetical protein